MTVFNKPEFNSVWASGGAKASPAPAKINQGWVVEIPPFEYDNWIRNRQDAILAHINQAGIVAWDASAEYQAGKSYVQGLTTGVVYKALTTHTGQNPELDLQGNWEVAFERSGQALLKAQNLADVPDKALARQNLGISTTQDYDSRYLRQVQNLADVPNKAAARNNLGIATTADYDQRYLVKSQNLADVPNKAAARNNLEVATTAEYDQRYLVKSQNLADVPNKAAGRANLGLGNSATLNVGPFAGNVAAGDDSRIVRAVDISRGVYAGGGLTGGGNLTADRTISMGTPSHITKYSQNTVSGATHTHALDVAGLFPFQGAENGYAQMPNGVWMIWGVSPAIAPTHEGVYTVYLHTPFPNVCLSASVNLQNNYGWGNASEKIVQLYGSPLTNRAYINVNIGYVQGSGAESYVRYFCIGY